MITISLWQPWASAIAVGLKKIETRSWPAECVGQRIAIHAAKSNTPGQRAWWMEHVKLPGGGYNPKTEAFRAFGIKDWYDLPFGSVVCTADLVQVETTEFIVDHELVTPEEEEWGNYSVIDEEKNRPRYGWLLDNIEALPKPIPAVGRQGFFIWRDAASLGTKTQ